jgi:hypothetical protein
MCNLKSQSTREALAKAIRRIIMLQLRPGSQEESLETQLANAQPVEHEAPEYDPEVQFTFLSRLYETNHGMWRCHFGHENSLVHFKGAYPFKYLTCGVCDHIICDRCESTEILTKDEAFPAELDSERLSTGLQSQELPYFSVCKHCGLSHRATLRKGHIDFFKRCECGREPEGDEVFGFIGSSHEWRKDPAARAVALLLQRFRV